MTTRSGSIARNRTSDRTGGEHAWHRRDGLRYGGDRFVDVAADRQADLDLGPTCVVLGVVDEGVVEDRAVGDVDPPAIPRLEDDGSAVDLADDAGVIEHVDVVAELDRPPGLQDDAGGEVLGDPAQGEGGHDRR